MLLVVILIALLNYFWLSLDPKECAGWYADQHCFKIGSEVIESVWDAVLTHKPQIEQIADEQGISKSYRKRRHAKVGQKYHPLSLWNVLCKTHCIRSLVNASAIFTEHFNRTGKEHSAIKDLDFLNRILDSVDFGVKEAFTKFVSWQRFTVEEKEKYSRFFTGDRNTIELDYSLVPQCVTKECKDGDLITAYRKYYQEKTMTMSDGMRYYYTLPPPWLRIDYTYAVSVVFLTREVLELGSKSAVHCVTRKMLQKVSDRTKFKDIDQLELDLVTVGVKKGIHPKELAQIVMDEKEFPE
jgi:hypothetical protein